MAGLIYPQYPVFPGYRHPYRLQQPFYKPKQPYWKPPYKGAPGPMKPANPLDSYRLAQLKALISQLGPGFSLGRLFTREVGVQVNPRVDACVQCSLGPRTLKNRRGGAFLYHAVPGQHAGLSIVSPVKFPQTIAVYSRLSDRRLFALPTQSHNRQAQMDNDDSGKDEGPKRPTFQFLERKFGFFQCRSCRVRWDSAYVWCVSGTNKVYFKQFCHKCQKGYNPYYVESIDCKRCQKTYCTCPDRRHLDLKRPHCQELCGRCKGQRLSCDKTYSFKYIM